MTNQGMILGAVLGASLVVGCAGSGHVEIDDLEHRSSEGLRTADLAYPGDGDIEVRGGDDDTDVPDIIIWDIAGGNVARQVEPGIYEEYLLVEDEQLQRIEGGLVTGSPTCTVIGEDGPMGTVFRLVDANGEVALTLWERQVFVGEVDVPAADQVAFSFEGERIHVGPVADGEVVARASELIEGASPTRLLLLGALVAGECGSDGLS